MAERGQADAGTVMLLLIGSHLRVAHHCQTGCHSGKEPRKPRRHGFARQRMAPTQRVEHEECPGYPLVRRLDPAHPGGDHLPQVPVHNRARLYGPHLPPANLLCTAGATVGKAASGGQPGQPDCGAARGGPAALPHHTVVSGHGARAQSLGPAGWPPPRPNWRASWNASEGSPMRRAGRRVLQHAHPAISCPGQGRGG